MNLSATDKAIWNKFGIGDNDTLPFTGQVGSRDTLAELMGELGFSTGAEIGVRDGVYSEILCKANPKLRLKCIDIWIMHSKVTGQEKTSRHLTYAKRKLAPYNVEIMKMDSNDALKIVPDGSLDFVYIDSNHEFDPVMMDIIFWSKKVRTGGIVSGHDYHKHYRYGVIPAVDTYTRAHNITSWYLTAEKYPSFFWVKA